VPVNARMPNYVEADLGGWAVSIDQGATWARHMISDQGFDWGQPTDSQGGCTYGADPSLVLTGQANQVAFVLLATCPGKSRSRVGGVAIAVSTDGGNHFGGVHLVNDIVAGESFAHDTDEPVAALNATTGKIWVAWTQKNPTFHLMVRELHYDAGGQLTFDTDAIDVTGSLPGTGNIGIGQSYNTTIAAGSHGGHSYVALAYTDHYENPACGPGLHPLDLTYYFAYAEDGSSTWHAVPIIHDPVWPQCVTTDQNGSHSYNRNRPAIAFAGGVALNFYVALTRSSPTGSLVHVYRVAWPFQPNNVSDFGSVPPDDGQQHDQFGPAIAIGYSNPDQTAQDSTAMNIMVTWHDTRADRRGMNLEQLEYGSVWGIFPWTGTVSIPSGAPNELVPWVNNGFWGDYEGLASDDFNHAFVAAWGDNRRGKGTEVWSAVLNPVKP